MNPQENRPGQPQYGVNGAPQQAPGGNYEVVPPPNVTGRPGGHNPYEFIVASKPQAKRPLVPGSNSFLGRLLLFVAGFALLLVVAGVALSSFRSGKDATPELVATALSQQELIRMAGQNPSSDALDGALTNISLSVTTSQQSLTDYLAQHGTKITAKQFLLSRDAKSDALLANAKATNTFDQVLAQVVSDDLATYQSKLQAAYKKATSTTLRGDLQQYFKTSVLLSEQLKAASAGDN